MKFVDMHCDTITALLTKKDKNENYSLRDNDMMIDLEKMKKVDYLLQNFAIFSNLKYGNAADYSKRAIALFEEEIEKNADLINQVRSYQDIEKNITENKMSALLTLEEGAVIHDNLDELNWYYDKGVRMITLTWNYPNGIGHPNVNAYLNLNRETALFSINTEDGLTEFGFDYVRKMDELGMIVDVSHLSDAGFYDVLSTTKNPFVASHSNARSICNVGRNMSDDMIIKLADRGGVMGLNFCQAFVNYDHDPSPVNDLITHVKHIVNIGGIDVMGLGTDYDGIGPNIELKDCSMMEILVDKLIENGFTSMQIDKIIKENVLRVYKEILK